MTSGNYTPSHAYVRAAWMNLHSQDEGGESFERWVREVKAAAWDEGHDAARTSYAGGHVQLNPYGDGAQ